MDFKRLRVGDWLAGAWGLALLASLWLDWYEVPGAGAVCAWQAFSVTDVVLAVVALAGLAIPLANAASRSAAVPVAAGVIGLALSAVALPILLHRLINEPGPNELVKIDTGAYIGLLCLIGLFASALAAVRDESSPSQAPVVPTELPAPPL